MSISLLSCEKSNRYVNKRIGYEITGPPEWHKFSRFWSPNVLFAKYRGKKYENSNIAVMVDAAVDRYQSPLDYINNKLLPAARLAFGELGPINVNVLKKGENEWAACRCYSKNDEVQIYYVTFFKQYVFIIVLTYVESQQIFLDEEELFLATLDSFIVY